nr:hypothetical protein [Candidatus Njordarchaeota archaeon]
MVSGKEEFFQFAEKLVSKVPDKYMGRWCFFAGFGYLLNGVQKETIDIDVLTKDQETYRKMIDLIQGLGIQLITSTENYSTFKASTGAEGVPKGLTIDLLLITSEWLKDLRGMWTQLEYKRVGTSSLPVLSPLHLILLKILINSHRKDGDKKRKRDFIDVRQLMLKRSLSPDNVIEEAISQGLGDLTRKFLEKAK